MAATPPCAACVSASLFFLRFFLNTQPQSSLVQLKTIISYPIAVTWEQRPAPPPTASLQGLKKAFHTAACALAGTKAPVPVGLGYMLHHSSHLRLNELRLFVLR